MTSGLDDELEVSGLLLLVTEPNVDPFIVPITKKELLLEQRRDPFFATVGFRLNGGGMSLFSFSFELLCSSSPFAMSRWLLRRPSNNASYQ